MYLFLDDVIANFCDKLKYWVNLSLSFEQNANNQLILNAKIVLKTAGVYKYKNIFEISSEIYLFKNLLTTKNLTFQ